MTYINALALIVYWHTITITFFNRLGNQVIHKELQEGMNGIDNILCKMDLNLTQRLTMTYSLGTTPLFASNEDGEKCDQII